ncbi:hypothetical protein BDW75DRAFT_241696 [Aspergillus navahoensis]
MAELAYARPDEFISERWYSQPELINSKSALRCSASPYNTQSQSEQGRPATTQIYTILRPYANYTGSLDGGLYLRLCYDSAKEEAHEAVWAGNLDAAFVGPDGIILDNREILGLCSSVSDALTVLPERVTNVGGVGHVQARERAPREVLSQKQGEEDEGQGDEGEGGNLIRYAAYHAACVVTHLFMEDEEALDGARLLHIFFNDCGNVVRQWRTDDEGGGYDGPWKEGVWKEDFYAGRGEGPAVFGLEVLLAVSGGSGFLLG